MHAVDVLIAAASSTSKSPRPKSTAKYPSDFFRSVSEQNSAFSLTASHLLAAFVMELATGVHVGASIHVGKAILWQYVVHSRHIPSMFLNLLLLLVV